MKNKDLNISLDIDYDSFTIDEIIVIMDFFNKMIDYHDGIVKEEELKKAYKEYRNTLNSLAFEKRYEKMFLDKTGISIYKTMKDIK